MQHTTSHESHLADALLSERLDDRLTPTAAQRVDKHLSDCPACAARYADLRATRSALRSLRAVTLPRDFRLDVASLSPASPLPLVPTRHIHMSRFLSAVALICGLFILAVGLFTLTNQPTTQEAASGASYPIVPTSCTPATRCPSVNAGAATVATPTFIVASGTTPKSPATSPASSSSGGSFGVAEHQPDSSNHNTTPSFVAIIFGILAALAGAIGLLRWRRPTPSPF